MAKRLFWEDPYAKEFDAKIVSLDGNRLVLDQTAFNPRGGGLVSDIGTVGGVRVIEAVKEDEEVVHLLGFSLNNSEGEPVHGVLDWDRRYRIMRMHTAAHILSSIVHEETGALITGNQIAPEESRVDLDLETFDRAKFSYYVDKVNEAAGRGLDVETFFMDREEALATPGFVKLANAMPPAVEMLRIVKIGDVDTQADGGVHVRNTIEIGRVVGLRAENKGRSNKRLHFTVE